MNRSVQIQFITPDKIFNFELVDYNTVRLTFSTENDLMVDGMFSFNNQSRKVYYEEICNSKYSLSKNLYKYHRAEWDKIYKENYIYPDDYSFVIDMYNNIIIEISDDILINGNYFYDSIWFEIKCNETERIIFNTVTNLSVVAELDFKKSEYFANICKVIDNSDDTPLFIPVISCNHICKFDRYSDFVNFDFNGAVETELKLSKFQTSYYDILLKNPVIKLSARELIEIIKKSNLKVSSNSKFTEYTFGDGIYLDYLEKIILDFKTPFKSLKSASSVYQSKTFIDVDIKKLAGCLCYCFENSFEKFSIDGLMYMFGLLNHNDYGDYNDNIN